jgi:hypothetical protein
VLLEALILVVNVAGYKVGGVVSGFRYARNVVLAATETPRLVP